MSAASPLAAVAAAGGWFEVHGDRLRLKARENLSPAVVASAFAEAREWHHRHREALAHHRPLHPEAAALAWGEMVNRWHRRHGERLPEWQCAGCMAPIGGGQALALADSNRVHFDTFDCLGRYGVRWRGAAAQALAAMGLHPPADDGEAAP